MRRTRRGCIFVFRDHRLSDLIGFVYSGMPAQDAANHLIRNIKDSARPLLDQGKNAVVSIILDGENAWEYYPQSGREFLRRFYDALQRDEQIEPVTICEAIARHAEADFGQLHRAGSGLVDRRQLQRVDRRAGRQSRLGLCWPKLATITITTPIVFPKRSGKLAWEELLIAEGSDWNWWYGPEHHSANDRDFDELYRKHLSNVYHALEGIPPEELSTPIISGVPRPSYIPQTAYVRARVDGLISGYFEWMGAASYTSDQRTSAMHGKQFLLDAVYAGLDADSISGRLDFHHEVPQDAYRLVINLEVWREQGNLKAAPDSYRLTVDAQGRDVQRWVLTNGEERNQLASFSADNRNSSTNGVEVALEKIFEMRVPFDLIGAQPGSRIRLRFAIWREHLPVDSLPLEGWIDLHALTEEELETNLYSFSPQD